MHTIFKVKCLSFVVEVYFLIADEPGSIVELQRGLVGKGALRRLPPIDDPPFLLARPGQPEQHYCSQ